MTVQVEYFIENCIKFLRGVNETSNVIYIELDIIFTQITHIFNTEILEQDPPPSVMQTCQTYNNLCYLQAAIAYYQKKIEKLLNIKPHEKFKSLVKIEQMKLKATELINDELTIKVESFLTNYKEVNWNPKQPNSQCHAFI